MADTDVATQWTEVISTAQSQNAILAQLHPSLSLPLPVCVCLSREVSQDTRP